MVNSCFEIASSAIKTTISSILMIWSDDEMGSDIPSTISTLSDDEMGSCLCCSIVERSDIPSTISTLSDDVMYHFYLLGIGGDNMTFMVVVIQR